MKKLLNLSLCFAISSAAFTGCLQSNPNGLGFKVGFNQAFASNEPANTKELLKSAQHYLNLAEKNQRPAAFEYELLAAEMYLKAGYVTKTKMHLSRIPKSGMPKRLSALKYILMAQVAVTEREGEKALRILTPISNLDEQTKTNQVLILETKSDAYTLLNNTIASAQTRSQLDKLLVDKKSLDINRQKLWQSLSSAPIRTILQAQQQNNDREFSGWLDLVMILRSQTSHKVNRDLDIWSQKFPNHPASQYISRKYKGNKYQSNAQSRKSYHKPHQIALLLPLEGAYSGPSNAIRDGFLAHYYQSNENNYNKPEVKIYDTTHAKMDALYYQAINEGADFIVGPLQKKNVLELSKLGGRLSTPVLALNQTPEITNTIQDFYQYALSPEDEARGIAKKAKRDGYDAASIIVPDNDWGKRVTKAFTKEWRKNGGRIISAAKVNPSQDQAAAVRKLLNVDTSQKRSTTIKNLLKEKVSFQPRRRQDIEVIILAAPPQQARQLRPLFDFYYAQEIPVYATSSVYSGSPKPKKDRDMNGIVFCDMPWLLDKNSDAQSIKALSVSEGSQYANQYARLFAMGADAYQLTQDIGKLAREHTRLEGATGTLYVDRKNYVNRKLTCAKIVSGEPRLL